MPRIRTLLIVFLPIIVCLPILSSLRVGAETPIVSDVTSRGLAFVAEAGESWIAKRGCVSCHQVPSLIWSHEAAVRAGAAVSADDLAKWKAWSTDAVNFVKPEQKSDCDEEATMASNIDTMVAMLLAIPQESDAAWRNRFTQKLVAEQADDGSWKACGQLPLQRRPELETQAVTTLWTTLALHREGVEFDHVKAIEFAAGVSKVESTEWLAVRLLVADSLGDANVESFRSKLIECQNDDGGWGWKVGEASDALGTGYALYALAKTGSEAASRDAARDFLARTQTDSGRWIVPGTKKSAKGKAMATSNDWGTAWAVIALSESE